MLLGLVASNHSMFFSLNSAKAMKDHLQTHPKGHQKATQTLPKGKTPPKGQQKGAKMQAKGKAQAQARAVLMWRNMLIM